MRTQGEVSEVVLRATPHRVASDSAGLAAVDGVQSVEPARDRVVIRVTRSHCDLLLSAALQQGWAVDGIRRSGNVLPGHDRDRPGLPGGLRLPRRYQFRPAGGHRRRA